MESEDDKFMKRLGLVIVLVLALTAVFCSSALAAEKTAVNVRVEGAEEMLYNGIVVCHTDTKATVRDVLEALAEAESDLAIEGVEYGYITSINGERAGRTALGWDGFGIRLDGAYVSYANLNKPVYNGADIVIYYADEFGEGLAVPMVDTSALWRGQLYFTAEMPDEDGLGTVISPIEGATVRWYCEDAFAEYVTDATGCVRIEESYLTSGQHRVSIQKNNAEGVPTLLRLSPDYEVTYTTEVGDSPALYIAIALMAIGALGLALLLPGRLKG